MSVASSLLALTLLLVPRGAAPQDDPDLPGPAALTGRFLLPDGTPAAGVELRVRGWGANQARILEFGQPKRWTDPSGKSDAEGRFRIRFLPPRAYQFVLDANLEGYAETSWRWGELAPGKTLELGDITLVPAGTVVGRVVDRDGNTLTKGWRITAETPRGAFGGRDATRVSASVDPATGEFRLEGVPARRVTVDGRNGGGVHTNQVTLEVVAGIENPIELVYDGPDLERRITVVHFSRPFYTYEPASASIKLIAADGTERTAFHVQGSSQSEAFDDLPDGEYRIEIDDPLYEPWSQDGVRPGERVNARLKGAATLEVEVVDGETGQPVPSYGLRVVFHRSNSRPNEFELLPDASTPPVDGVFEGMIPTDLQLLVRPPGRPQQRVLVEGLTRGERRRVRVELGSGARLTGRVVDAAGAPIIGARVERTPGERAGLPEGMSRVDSTGRVPNFEETYSTDGRGRFEAVGLPLGAQTLRVRFSPWITVDRTVTLPLPAGEALELRAPSSGWLEGELILPPGATTEGLALMLEAEGIEGPSGFERSQEGGGVAADGTFRYGPLPVRELRVAARFLVPLGGGSASSHRQPLGAVTIEPGATTRATWDLRETFPGSARITLLIDGDPFQRVSLSFEQAGNRTSGPLLPDDVGLRVRSGLAPGTWTLGVTGPDNTWQWHSPDPIRVEAGRATDVELTLDLVARRVRLLDAENGAPLAGAEVVAWTGERGFAASSTRATTGADGTLELRLPPGEVRLCRAQPGIEPVDPRSGRFQREQEAADSVALEWEAAAGELVVRLPRREE